MLMDVSDSCFESNVLMLTHSFFLILLKTRCGLILPTMDTIFVLTALYSPHMCCIETLLWGSSIVSHLILHRSGIGLVQVGINSATQGLSNPLPLYRKWRDSTFHCTPSSFNSFCTTQLCSASSLKYNRLSCGHHK